MRFSWPVPGGREVNDMAIGRLAWRTPTGGMLWEVWGRYKSGAKYQAAALLGSLALVYWRKHAPGVAVGEVLAFIPWYCFLGVYLHLLTCFGYLDVVGGDLNMGFPRRLFLKPLCTAQLAAIPMFVGGMVLVGVFAIWAQLVLGQVVGFLATPWFGACLLSLFWWVQATAWSAPESQAGRSLIVLSVAVVNLLVGLLPLLPAPPPLWVDWSILGVVLGSAWLIAVVGLQWVRQGAWVGPSLIGRLWRAWRPARPRARRKKFRSAFHAQFWLEWQRQGRGLPFLTGAMLLLFPLFLLCTGLRADQEQTLVLLGLSLAIPLIFSSVFASALAKFDLGQSGNQLPVYIAIRPMTNGGFVLAKLAMAGASSALTWLVTLFVLGVWFCFLADPALRAHLWHAVLSHNAPAILVGCVPPILLLLVLTWKNLVAGIGLGLAGNPWLSGAFAAYQALLLLCLLSLVTALKLSPEFQTWLLYRVVRWGPWVLISGLAIKLTVACAAFTWSYRRNAITRSAIGWIVGGWAACGLFAGAYGALICVALAKPEALLWVALAGFSLMPLAGLALASPALRWNRHR